MKLSVIIPAFNEEKTIGDVIKVAKTHPDVDEVIVVNDGSEDRTSLIAKESGAKVINLSQNQGKASALIAGVDEAKNDYLFFMDADLIGLTHEIMDIPIQKVLRGQFDMFIAVVERDEEALKKIPSELHILGGTRVLSKEIWNLVPPQYMKGFQIEIALNYFAEHHGKKAGYEIMKEFSHTPKEKKQGLFQGFWNRIKMIAELVKIVALLYLMHRALAFVKQKIAGTFK